MRKFVAAVIAALAVAGSASADTTGHPYLTVANTGPGVVQLNWVGVDGDLVVLWQCFPAYGCFDTLRPNQTPLVMSGVYPGQRGFQVCSTTSYRRDNCSNIVALTVE